MTSKILAFEYVVSSLVDWFNEVNKEKNEDFRQNFSKLKLIKLHFFVSAVDADKKDKGLLSTFDNFYALPYGHVESDVYKALDQTIRYKLLSDSLSIKDDVIINIDLDLKGKIDASISKLKNINPDLVNYSAFDLVELSHKWYSWKTAFEQAKREGKYSAPISSETIQYEPKFFY